MVISFNLPTVTMLISTWLWPKTIGLIEDASIHIKWNLCISFPCHFPAVFPRPLTGNTSTYFRPLPMTVVPHRVLGTALSCSEDIKLARGALWQEVSLQWKAGGVFWLKAAITHRTRLKYWLIESCGSISEQRNRHRVGVSTGWIFFIKQFNIEISARVLSDKWLYR